jgi:phosphoribulokinase
MSVKHPIIAVTGSSGAGTTSVTRTFNWIFRREKINAVIVEGDSFHRYDRNEMKAKMAEATARGDHHFSHFGAENNLFNLAGCSMIVAPFGNTREQMVGAIGVIGPMRMNYARIVPMVDYTAKLIGRLLGSP